VGEIVLNGVGESSCRGSLTFPKISCKDQDLEGSRVPGHKIMESDRALIFGGEGHRSVDIMNVNRADILVGAKFATLATTENVVPERNKEAIPSSLTDRTGSVAGGGLLSRVFLVQGILVISQRNLIIQRERERERKR